MAKALLGQPDCITAWRNAAGMVGSERGREAYDVLIEVLEPTSGASLSDPGVALVDKILTKRAKPLASVANTIFPQALYERHGYPNLFEAFDQIVPRVSKNERWSGYYFERMTRHHNVIGERLNPLREIIERMKDPEVKSRMKFELPIFDLDRDVNLSPYGGQCLSHISFKLAGHSGSRVNLTCLYRNHYYIEKLLGNLIGLGRLQAFVASETNREIGTLTVLSTHAVIDKPGSLKHSDIDSLLEDVERNTT